MHGLLIHGEVSSPWCSQGWWELSSRLHAGALCRRAGLVGGCPSARAEARRGADRSAFPALPTQNLLSPPRQAAAHPLRSGSWISAFTMPLAPAFLVSRVMLWCLPLLLCSPPPARNAALPRPWSSWVSSVAWITEEKLGLPSVL